jgi:hypothetical protein
MQQMHHAKTIEALNVERNSEIAIQQYGAPQIVQWQEEVLRSNPCLVRLLRFGLTRNAHATRGSVTPWAHSRVASNTPSSL